MQHKTTRLLSLSVILLVIVLVGCSTVDLQSVVSTALARTANATTGATTDATTAATSSATASTAGAKSPDAAILAYLNALVSKDQNQFAALICPAFTKKAALEFDSFGAVKTGLKGVTCKTTTTKGDYTLVTCTGSISIDYNGTTRSLNLSKRIYQTAQDGGTWKMCGYQP